MGDGGRFERFADYELRDLAHATYRDPLLEDLTDEILEELDLRTGWCGPNAKKEQQHGHR